MPIMTYLELDNSLKAVQNPVSNYDTLLFDYFENMYNTGCRPEELLNINLWESSTAAAVTLFPLKGNNARVIPRLQLTSYLNSAINAGTVLYSPLTYRRFRYHFKKFYFYSGTAIGAKDVELYLFRHRYVKSLNLAGYTDLQIQALMGWTNLSIVSNYVNSVITRD